MKRIAAGLAALFAIYTALESYAIAAAGVANHIAQLEGDGGGGMAFSLLCLVAGILVLRYPLGSVYVFLFATILIVWVGFLYEDSIMYVWGVVPLILGAMGWVVRRTGKRNRVRTGARIVRGESSAD